MKNKELLELFEIAAAVRENAYAPYSNFKVGAAVLDDSGVVHAGCNVEVANYKGGTCAEGTAIAKMISSGKGPHRIKAVVIVGSGDTACSPCGHCRQFINEFADANTRIYTQDPSTGMIRSATMEKLLPDAFGPNNL